MLAALALGGCGSGPESARVLTASPSAFVEGVRDLVRPAERMGVIATAALAEGTAQASSIEVDGLVDHATRELRQFRALRLGDRALVAEQSRIVRLMGPIVSRMRTIRTVLRTDARRGLAEETSTLLRSLEAIPSAARS